MKAKFLSRASGIALLVGISAIAASGAQAQGFFGSLEGRYDVIGKSRLSALTEDQLGNPLLTLHDSVQPDNGWGGRIFLGYRFPGNWDIGVGGAGDWFGKNKVASDNGQPPAPGGSPENEQIRTKGHQWSIDLEAGYNVDVSDIGASLRLFGGARYVRLTQSGGGHYFGSFPLAGQTTHDITYDVGSRYWGIGPRLGAMADVPFGRASNFGVSFALSGAVLFGHLKSSLNGSHTTTSVSFPGLNGTVPLTGSDSGSQTVYNAEGEVGLWYALSQNFKVTAGYRAEGWFNAIGNPGGNQSTDRIVSGPFVRASFDFAPPPPPPAVAPPPPPPPVAMAKKSFIVFFDFDKSTITSQAQSTINDAVAAAKAGNSARVTLTGHTDRSGSEQYNMALSLRRAEAVKASMIRQGIPASAIVVIGKGESQPLVPTADGVREPQNRRVEILI
jgi:outer membrane protein OmpA-like peptidoglycan-associated protein